MKKVCLCCIILILLSSFFLIQLKGNAKEQVYLEENERQEEKKVEISFKNKTVTTKTLSSLFQNRERIIALFFENTFPYLDETMEYNLSHIDSTNLEEYEEVFRKKLESYGFFDVSEQIQRKGIVLKKVEVYLPLNIIEKLKNIKGIQIS